MNYLQVLQANLSLIKLIKHRKHKHAVLFLVFTIQMDNKVLNQRILFLPALNKYNNDS